MSARQQGNEPEAPDGAGTRDPRLEEARALERAEPQGAQAPRIREAAGPRDAAANATAGADAFLRRFAKGAGVPEHIFARQDGLKVAEELGALMRLTVEDSDAIAERALQGQAFRARRRARP